jgi:tape measure domain-containing protein
MAEYRVEFTADSSAAERSIKALKREIKGVTKEFEGAEIGAAEFLEAASDLSGLQKELKDARGAVVNIDKAYQDLNKALDSMGSAYDKAGRNAENHHKKLIKLAEDSYREEDRLLKKRLAAEEETFNRILKVREVAKKKEARQQQAVMEFRAGMGARGAIPEIASPVRGGAAFPGSPAYLEEIAKAAKKAQQELDDAAKAAGTIAPQAKAFDPASLASYETKLKLLKKEARLISPDSTRWKELTKEILQAERGIERINKRQRLGPTGGQRLGAAGGAFLYGGGLGGGAGSALGGIAGGLAGGVPGAFAGAALGQLADNIGQALGATASYTAEIDKQRIALKNVTKDVAEYQNALAFIDKTSRDLAIPQDVLNKQFTQISASVIGAGGDIGLAKEAFMGIAAGIRGTGGSLAALEGALLATSQVFSKGKVSAEELRQQIGERLPGAFTLFAKSMGKTPQELDKMLEQGEVTLNDFMGFVRTLSSEYGASASEIAASSQAAGDRLATTMSRMREAVGRELQPLGAQFQEILANAVADNEGNLVALAKAFSEAAQAIGRFIEQYGGLIASLGSTILLIGGTALAVKGIATAYAAIGPAIAAATAAIASYGGALSVAKLAMAGLGGPITLTIAGLVLLGKGVYDTNETFRNFVDNIGGVIASDFKNAVDGMAEDAKSSANNIQTAYEDLTTKLDPIGQFIKELFRDVFKDTSDSAEASATASSGSFNDFFKSLSTSATEGFNGLNTIISNWWSSLPAPIRNIFGGNAASMLVGAAGYAAALPGRASAPNAQSTGMYGRYGSPESQVPIPKGNAMGTPIGSFVGGAGGGSGKGGKDAKPKRIPLEQLLPAGWESALKVNLSKAELRLTELITAARLQGNEAEAESLEGLSSSLQLRIKLAAATNFANMLRQKEGEIIAKSLTKEQFNIKLKDADNEAAELSNELKRSYLDMQVRENEAQKKAKNALDEKVKQQLSLNRLLEDAAILAGVVSPQQAAISGQRRGFQDQLLQAKELGATPEQIVSLEGFQAATPQAGSLQETLRGITDELNKLISTQEMVKTSASAIGDAFGQAFKGIITGTTTAREALAGFFQSIADSFADMVSRMIAEWLKAQLIKGFMSLFPGGSALAGATSAASTGLSFDPGGMAGFSAPWAFANGGIAPGGFQAFANGGIVTGPTLGLVGEGRYNEAVIPLPDGKSVPVDLGGAMGSQITSNIVVNVSSDGKSSSSGAGSDSAGLGRKIEGAVKQVIVGELRPGGLLAGKR